MFFLKSEKNEKYVFSNTGVYRFYAVLCEIKYTSPQTPRPKNKKKHCCGPCCRYSPITPILWRNTTSCAFYEELLHANAADHENLYFMSALSGNDVANTVYSLKYT